MPYPEFLLEFPFLPNGQRTDIHDKYLQIAEFETFTLANVHTLPLHVLGSSYDSGTGKKFAREVEKVLLERLISPLIFCGDFNHQNIAVLYPKLFDELGLVDGLPDETSVPTSNVRIDYMLFSSNHFRILSAGIQPTLADHFPCWLELAL